MSNIKMRDSGIEWIGMIPEHWKVLKLKQISIALTGITYNPNNIVDEHENNSILVLRSSNIQNSKIDFKDNVFVNLKISSKYLTKEGDILVCSRNGSRKLLGKNILIEKVHENLTFGAFTTVVRSKYNRYIRYFLNSGVFNHILNSSSSTINQLTIGDIKKTSICFPHISEQTAIANYLDHHTAKIDSEIDYLEKKSSLLEEYKQSLIFETVTKGLDKSVPMKDSGIDWIGEIPAHWEVKRVKDVLLLKKEKPLNWKTHKILSLTISGVIEKDEDNHKGKNPESYDTYQLVSKQDLLLCLFDIDVTPGIVGVSNYIGLASSAYTVAKAININPYYFSYFFYSFHKNKKLMNKVKGLRSSFQKDTFKDLPLYYPPINEQQQIADFLDKERSKIDKQRNLMKKKIELLKEYKQSLIYEAVTGKIEIPQEFYKENI